MESSKYVLQSNEVNKSNDVQAIEHAFSMGVNFRRLIVPKIFYAN